MTHYPPPWWKIWLFVVAVSFSIAFALYWATVWEAEAAIRQLLAW